MVLGEKPGGVLGGPADLNAGRTITEQNMLTNFFKIKMAGTITTTAGVQYNEITGANLQAAIDSLDHGFVFVGGDITLDTPIVTKANVSIDFLGHYVTLNTDTKFLLVERTKDITVKNCTVNLYPTQTQPVIHLHTTNPSSQHIFDAIERNTFENIYLHNTAGKEKWIDPATGKEQEFFQNHGYEGLLLELDENTFMRQNIFSNIYIEGAKIGLHLYKGPDAEQDRSAFGHHNYFKDIMCWDYQRFLWMDVPSIASQGWAANTFLNVHGRSTEYSEYGFLIQWSSGGFFFSCMVSDWANWKVYQGWPNVPQPYDWVLSPKHNHLRWNYIFSKPNLMLNEGLHTQKCGPLQTWPPLP